METEGGAQQDRFIGGVQEVAVRLAARLDDAVRLAIPVRRISRSPADVTVDADGHSVQARRVIVACPPPKRADSSTTHRCFPPGTSHPAAPPQLGHQVPPGLRHPWWRERGLSGLVLCIGEPVGVTLDGTQPGGPGVITGFIEGAHAVAAGRPPTGR